MATPEQIKAWCATTRPRNWYGACAGLTYNTIAMNGGDASLGPYPSATAAYESAKKAGGIKSRNPLLAPPGAIHYWSYYGRDWRGIYGNWGHVAVDIYGGGSRILSATSRAREYWGLNAGILSVHEQTIPAMKYLGWALTFGRHNRITIDAGQPAGQEEDVALTADEISAIGKAAASAVWGSTLGPKDSPNADRGKAGDLLAQTSARAYKAATRSGQALALLVSAEGDPDVAAIVSALKEALPAAVVDELKARL